MVEIKNEIETINGGKPTKNKKDFMKIKFYSDDDDLPLGRILNITKCIIVVESVFKNDNKYYQQVYIHESGDEF